MATLSPTQLATYRRKIGDHDPDTANGYDLTDAQIQAVYDDNDSDEISTIVELLEMRWGIWINVSDAISDTGGTTLISQKRKAIKSLLDYYNAKAGEGYFTLGSGTSSVAILDFNLDTDSD